MQKVMKNIPDERLKAYIIWLPALPGDNLAAAIARSREFTDKRAIHFWDNRLLAGNLWKPIIEIPRQIAWDVYFLYRADAQWNKKPSKPDFWMHQLGGVSNAPRLDGDAFEKKAKEMLGIAE